MLLHPADQRHGLWGWAPLCRHRGQRQLASGHTHTPGTLTTRAWRPSVEPLRCASSTCGREWFLRWRKALHSVVAQQRRLDKASHPARGHCCLWPVTDRTSCYHRSCAELPAASVKRSVSQQTRRALEAGRVLPPHCSPPSLINLRLLWHPCIRNRPTTRKKAGTTMAIRLLTHTYRRQEMRKYDLRPCYSIHGSLK